MDESERSRALHAALPFHIAETVNAVAQIHSDHHLKRTRLEALIDHWTDRFARPPALIALACAIALWIGLNLMLSNRAIDPPPFPYLFGALSLFGLVLGILILSTQRRADQLAVLREQMTLELASVTERKVAKVIELIEEIRRDSPELRNRVDHEARQMATRTNPGEVLVAIKESHDEMREKATEGADEKIEMPPRR